MIFKKLKGRVISFNRETEVNFIASSDPYCNFAGFTYNENCANLTNIDYRCMIYHNVYIEYILNGVKKEEYVKELYIERSFKKSLEVVLIYNRIKNKIDEIL